MSSPSYQTFLSYRIQPKLSDIGCSAGVRHKWVLTVTLGSVEQRKRLTIGVELAAKPELLLFLDEPTSGLDSQTSKQNDAWKPYDIG